MRSSSVARRPASRRSTSAVATSMLKLHNYFRSSAAYRVRIALNLKGLSYEYLPVHLVKGEQRAETYRAINPQALVPAPDRRRREDQSIDGDHRVSRRKGAASSASAGDARRSRAGAQHRAGHRLRHPPAEQPAGAEISGRTARRRARTQRMPGTGTGSSSACRPSRPSSPPTSVREPSVTEMRRRWPTSVSFRSSPMPAAARSPSIRIRRWRASRRIASRWTLSPAPRRIASPTPS